MREKLIACLFVLVTLPALSVNVKAQQQLPDYKALAEYVFKERNAPDAARIIVEHLEQTATTEPLEELIRWENAGFPELRNEDKTWKIDVYGFELCVASAVNFYFAVSPPAEKGKLYLETIERLRKNGTILYQLTQSAYKFLTVEEMEREFFRLIDSPDAEERARGLNFGRSLAEQNRDVFNVYAKILKQDKNGQVRNTALHVLGTIRKNYAREVALLALEQLLDDDNVHVKEIASVLVRQGADLRAGWTKADAPFLLLQMLKTDDYSIRKTLGITMAKLTSDDAAMYVIENNLPENLFNEIVERINARRNELNRDLEAEELLAAWKDWWTPLAPKYMKKAEAIACG